MNAIRRSAHDSPPDSAARKGDERENRTNNNRCHDHSFATAFCGGLRRYKSGDSRGFGIALNALEISSQFGCCLVSQLAVFFEQLRCNPAQVREKFEIQSSGGYWSPVQDGLEDDRGCSETEGEPPGRHLIHHRSQRKKIAALIEFFSASLLGRHIRYRAERYPPAGQVARLGHSRKNVRTFFVGGRGWALHELG